MDKKARLYEFIHQSGHKISINPAGVVSIAEYPDHPDLCYVLLDGQTDPLIIKGSYAEVKERCLY